MGQVLAFDPSKPFTVVPPPSSPPPAGLATVGEQMAAKGMSKDQLNEFLARDPEAVTLGDVLDNPAEGFARMGAILKRDLTDPKTWMAAAAMYFGPKVLPKVAPLMGKAIGATARGAVKGAAAVGDMLSPDIVGVVSPRAGRALELAQRLRAKMPAETPAASVPVEPAAPGPQATPPPSTQAASQLARMSGALTDEEALAVDGLVKQGYPREDVLAAVQQQRSMPAAPAQAVASVRPKLSAPEAKTYIQLRKAGKTDAQAYEALAAMRALGGPTDVQVQKSVAHRNSTGRW